MEAEAASAIIGVCPSATASSEASAVGAMVGPTIASTWSSAISRRTLRTACAGSEASSSTMTCARWPPSVVGHICTVFRVGMPMAAAGPVVDSTTPMRRSARAGRAMAAALASSARPCSRRRRVVMGSPGAGGKPVRAARSQFVRFVLARQQLLEQLARERRREQFDEGVDEAAQVGPCLIPRWVTLVPNRWPAGIARRLRSRSGSNATPATMPMPSPTST